MSGAARSRSGSIHDPAVARPGASERVVLALAAVRALHFAAAIQAIGALLFVCILERPSAFADDAAGPSATRWLMNVAVLSAIAIVPSGIAWLVLQAADMTG